MAELVPSPQIEDRDEQMLIIFNHVRPDRRWDYISFIENVLCPAANHIQPRSVCHTKLLEPGMPNEDGSYTYVIMMDPAFEYLDDTIDTILRHAFGGEVAQEYLEIWRDFLAEPKSKSLVVDKP